MRGQVSALEGMVLDLEFVTILTKLGGAHERPTRVPESAALPVPLAVRRAKPYLLT
jgi:hypothetical protein